MTDTPEQATLRASIRNRVRQAGWWAPLKDGQGHPTHPGAPHKQWLRLCAHEDPQTYGAGTPGNDHSIAMYRVAVPEYVSMGYDASAVRPTFQAYGKSIADHVACMTVAPESQQWDFLERKPECDIAARIVRALTNLFGFGGEFAVRDFETYAAAQNAYPGPIDNRAGTDVIAAILKLAGVDVRSAVDWSKITPVRPPVPRPKMGMYLWPNRGAAVVDIPACIAALAELGYDHVIAQAGMDTEHWIHRFVPQFKAAGLGTWVGYGMDGAWTDPKVGANAITEALKNEPTEGQVSLDDERANKWETEAGRAIADGIVDDVFAAFGLPPR